MPEGPEVKTNAAFLQSALEGKVIKDIEIISGRYVSHGPFKGHNNFVYELPVKVSLVDCKGKFIYFLFEDTSSLWSTLGMSGQWQNHKTKHTRVVLTTEGGRKVYFNDIRNFGTLKYATNLYELQDKLQSLGVDILCERYVKDPKEFVELFSAAIKSKPKKTIAENIMNQNLISGVGNYLKAEILYHAGISPHRVCGELEEHEIKALALFSQMIAWKSYESGGATISTYRKENGEEGLYNRRFVVYNQKYDLKGNEVIKETTKDKRTTHWVPAVQV